TGRLWLAVQGVITILNGLLVLVRECRVLLEFRVHLHNLGNLVIRNLYTFAAKTLAHLLVHARSINELYLPLTFRLLGVIQQPDIRGNASVVEQVIGQRDDGFDEVVLEKITSDFGLT